MVRLKRVYYNEILTVNVFLFLFLFNSQNFEDK